MMKKKCKLRIFMLMVAVVMVGLFLGQNPQNAYADEKQYVYDDAEIYTEEQIEELTQICKKYSEEIRIDLIITTIEDAQGKDSQTYADDFMDENRLGYEEDDRFDKSCIMVLFDFDNQYIYFDTTGLGIYYIDDDYIDQMFDDVYESTHDSGDYYRGAKVFLQDAYWKVANHRNADIEEKWEDFDGTYEEFYDENIKTGFFTIFKNVFVDILIAIVITVVVLSIFIHQNKSKMTVNADTYLNRNHSKLNVVTDQYLRTTTSRVKITSESSGDSGGSFHSSGGGHSHGGGGGHM